MKPFFASASERAGARARLRDLIREHSLKFGTFELASGGTSSFYLDLRRTTTHPEGAYLVSCLIMDKLVDCWPDAAGGPTLGADPMAGSLAALSHLHGNPLPTFIVRSGAKNHGTQQQVEGHLNRGDQIVLLDDVITRGGSLLRAIDSVHEIGGKVTKVMTILDRQAGGAEALAEKGLKLESLFLLHDIVTAKEQAGATQ